MSCGCSPSSSTPPGSSSSGAVSPRSSGGSLVVTRQKACAPSPCPTPPTSSQTGREAYSPAWAATLLGALSGKLLLLVESGIQYFRARRSGWLFYDATTEQVTSQQPPFLTNDPTEVKYGFLAKVTTEIQRTCDPETDAVTETIVQKLASQVMGDADQGQLVLANMPDCGEVTGDQAADADKQVRLDYLAPKRHESCEKGVGFLVRVPVTVGAGTRNEKIISQWRLLEQMRVRASQFGFVEPNTAEAEAGLLLIASPVDGGTTEDPCYRLKILKAQSRGLPVDPRDGDTIYYSDAEKQWKIVKRGLGFHPLSESVIVINNRSTAGTVSASLPDYPSDAPGEVWGRFQIRMTVTPSGSIIWAVAAGGSTRARCDGTVPINQIVECMVKLTGDSCDFSFSKTGSGAFSGFVTLIGYDY